MAATESNLAPVRQRQGERSSATKFWDDDFAWPGATQCQPPLNVCPLCSGCQSLLMRPTCDPSTQKGIFLTDKEFVIRQSVSRISNNAMNGCVICKLVMAAQTAISQQMISADQPDGFVLALYWFGDKDNRFDRIEVTPIGYGIPTLQGHIHGIKLVLEDEPGDKAIKYLSPLHTGSQLCGAVAMRWLENCITHHAKCREMRTGTGWLPTRLIDVGLPGDTRWPRLVLSSELKGQGNIGYTTLSHRWSSSHVVKLVSSNINSFRQCIPSESLSNTFLDAIRVTRAVGIRYLWIDSLCIIQDSFIDWQAESAEMGNVYRNCIYNLAATGGSDNGGGLFQERNAHWVTPNKVHIQYQGHHHIYSASLCDPWGKWVSRSTLNRRGWVFQERMLSPRTLHFASQLFWECRMLQACETYPEGMPRNETMYTEMDGFEYPLSFKDWYKKCDSTEIWYNIVENYGRCSLTVPTDRLVAIAGIAKSMQPLLHDEYLAGLWKKDLPYNLVWSIEGEVQEPQRYRAPSWSWVALDYDRALITNLRVCTEDRVKALVCIQDAHIQPLESDAFGPLQGGHLLLTGRIGRIFSLSVYQEGVWEQGHYSFEVDTDLGLGSIDDEWLYCLPLLIRTSPTIVACLLLKRIRSNEYTRVGILNVSLMLEDILPQEIRWIAEYANSKTCLQDLNEVVIY